VDAHLRVQRANTEFAGWRRGDRIGARFILAARSISRYARGNCAGRSITTSARPTGDVEFALTSLAKRVIPSGEAVIALDAPASPEMRLRVPRVARRPMQDRVKPPTSMPNSRNKAHTSQAITCEESVPLPCIAAALYLQGALYRLGGLAAYGDCPTQAPKTFQCLSGASIRTPELAEEKQCAPTLGDEQVATDASCHLLRAQNAFSGGFSPQPGNPARPHRRIRFSQMAQPR
jgi:hypothetical protein